MEAYGGLAGAQIKAFGASRLVRTKTDLRPVPSGHEIYFTTMKPERGIFDSQRIGEDAALIAYHHALHQTCGQVLYSPNKEGIWQLVFTVPMRDAPKVAIELVDPDPYVDEKDLIGDSRVTMPWLDSRFAEERLAK